MAKPPKLTIQQKAINTKASDKIANLPCIACGGSGYYDPYTKRICSSCDGTGKNKLAQSIHEYKEMREWTSKHI